MRRFFPKNRIRPFLFFPFLLLCAGLTAPGGAAAASSSAGSPEGSTSSSAFFQTLRLKGVINVGNKPKALIALTGVEQDFLLSEGDLLGGFTIQRVHPDQIELSKGTERRTLTMRHLRWIKADSTVKVRAPEMPKPAPAKPRTYVVKKATPAKSSSSSVLLSSARPRFVHPMLNSYGRPKGRVSSWFGNRRPPKTRFGYGSTYHKGVDIAAPSGTNVCASAAGVVTRVSYDRYKGRYVEIRHSGGYKTRYLHLNYSYSKNYVKVGQAVEAGHVIGLEGDTGNSRGAHLHFEILYNDRYLDPGRFISSLKRP